MFILCPGKSYVNSAGLVAGVPAGHVASWNTGNKAIIGLLAVYKSGQS